MNRPNLDDFKYRYKSKAFYVTKYSKDLDKYINYLEAELNTVKNNSPLPNITQRSEQLKGDYTQEFLIWKRDFWIYIWKLNEYKARYKDDYCTIDELVDKYPKLHKNKSPFNGG